MNRVVILVLLIICVFCRTKLPEQEYVIENQNTNLIDVIVLSNKTLILSGTKINIKDFDNVPTKELGKVTDISSCIIVCVRRTPYLNFALVSLVLLYEKIQYNPDAQAPCALAILRIGKESLCHTGRYPCFHILLLG